jgi:hypothetical protein
VEEGGGMVVGAGTSVTVRVTGETRAAARELAEKLDVPITQVLADAIEVYRRKVFWDEFNAAVERLQADPQAWAEELAERKVWDRTLKDGMEPEEWTDADFIVPPGA